MSARRSNQSLAEALPELLSGQGLSLRKLAAKVGVSQPYLSKLLRRPPAAGAPGELALRIAVALDLAEDYFPETRRARVIAAIDADPELRDRLYDESAAGQQ